MSASSPVVLNIATSLDGYIAGAHGDISWLDEMNVEGEDYGMGKFLADVDSVIMGSRTYETILSFGLDVWPYDAESFVMSGRALPHPWEEVHVTDRTPRDVVDQCRANHDGAIWLVGGAKLAASFMSDDLIDVMIISMVPVTLGFGISLFPSTSMDQDFTLVDSHEYDNGMVQLRYERS